MKTYIGISRDHSVSMRSLSRAAARDYNETTSGIREQSLAAGEDTIVSVVRCGSGPRAGVVRESINSSINVLQPINENAYVTDGGATPLFDSVGDLITQLENVPDANLPGVSFLVMAITDGEENSSREWSASRLMAKIQQLQRTDKWTFVFRVPRGYAQKLSRQFGIPAGNILEWDQTERGMAVSTQATKEAFTTYFAEKKLGKMSSTKFYTNLSDVSIKDVKKALVDISPYINLWTVATKDSIRPFCEAKSGKPFIKGAAFYQLTKTEDEVQDYKQVVIRDKVSGAIYGGPAARDMLGLPKFGTIRVHPGDHGQFDIFLQSTSVNRALPAGTQLLYWPTFNDPIQPAPAAKAAPAKSVAKTPVAAPAAFAPSKEYILGYSEGFDCGKMKSSDVRMYSGDRLAGFQAGYKDGRGKKKRLYK